MNVRNTEKSKELSTKLRVDHKQGTGYNKMEDKLEA